jgi:hypothetical protein
MPGSPVFRRLSESKPSPILTFAPFLLRSFFMTIELRVPGLHGAALSGQAGLNPGRREDFHADIAKVSSL